MRRFTLLLTLFLAPGAAFAAPATSFTPPPYAAMPTGKFGAAVKLGENIFRHTTIYGKGIIGDGLNCSNCHLADLIHRVV